MKKYINRFFMLATLLVAGMAFVSCEKENGPVEGTFTMSVNAVKGGSNASKALTGDGDAINATWTADDVVKVYKSGVEVGSLTAASSGASTKLNGSITGSIAEGDNLTLEFLSPDYQNGQDGTLDYIAAHCDYAVANVTVASISGDEIRITGNSATFENQQAIVKFTLQDKANDADLSASAFSVEVDGYIYAVVPASVTNVFYVALPAISDKKVSLFAKTAAGWYSYGQTGISFANGQYYTISAKLEQTGKLPGVFSIDGSHTVHFSQGNLQYDQSTTTWSFMDYQWSTVETSGQDIGDGYANQNIVGLFGWSADGTNNFGISTSTDYSDYLGSFVDWGTNNITNGGGANHWSTPSIAAWQYIFNTRSASTGRYAKAYLFGTTHGMILFPDHYTHPNDVPVPTGINLTDYTSWNGNQYTAEQWAKMEAAGAVFLPAAGRRRNGTGVNYDGDYGYFWSSTAYGGSYVWSVFFFEYNVFPVDGYDRDFGQSVRLVCE